MGARHAFTLEIAEFYSSSTFSFAAAAIRISNANIPLELLETWPINQIILLGQAARMPTLLANLELPIDNRGVGEVGGEVEEADAGLDHMSLPGER
jgi:hypothetical protein